MNRPTGVAVLAILDFVAAGFCVLLTLGAFLGGAIFGAFLARMAGRPELGAGAGILVGAVLGVMFLIGAAIAGVIGFGMWNLKEWGRILQIVFAALGALFRMLVLLTAMTHFRIFGMLWNLIWLAFNAWIIYYLVQPQIKAAFAAQPVSAATGR